MFAHAISPIVLANQLYIQLLRKCQWIVENPFAHSV
jgi:hypothetical protein